MDGNKGVQMRKLIMVVGFAMALAWCQPVWAEDKALSTKVWDAVGTPVKVVVTVGHEGLHLVQDVVGGLMKVSHSALDVLGIPWTNGD
jgi:hypothetical protein